MSFGEDFDEFPGKIDRKYGKTTIIGKTGKDVKFSKKTTRQAAPIDSQFDLDEDHTQGEVEKYGSDLDISSEDEDSDEREDHVSSLTQQQRSAVPQSMPINVNFGVDPMTKRPKSPSRFGRDEKSDKIPHGSIYENMQELSRSIQPADYRNRVLGTRPENAGVSMSYSLCSHTVQKPRAIICNEPAKCLDTAIESTSDRDS